MKTCAAGLHYSTTLEECTSPAEAACYREQDPCPLYNDPTNLIYHQDDADCSKYYLCYENKMHEFSCAEGLHWDTENERCSYPQDAECEVRIRFTSRDFEVLNYFPLFSCTKSIVQLPDRQIGPIRIFVTDIIIVWTV